MAAKKIIDVGDRVRKANFVRSGGSDFVQAKNARKGIIIGFGIDAKKGSIISIHYDGEEKPREELFKDWQDARYVRGVWNLGAE